MREILFRGKRKDNGDWVYGYPVKKIDPLLRTEKWFILIQEYCKSCIDGRPTILGAEMSWYEVIPETVGQYTGLTDKNGKKIFEGDILQIITGNGWSCPKGTKVYYEVVFTEFNEECATWAEYIGYMAKRDEDDLSSIHYVVNSYGAKVIGNIHDNPELLKGGGE